MARKRKKSHHSRRRRHSMSGTGGGMMQAVAVIGGAIAGRMASNMLSAKVDPKISNAGVLALGFFIPKFVKGPMGAGLGCGLIASGGVGLLTTMGVIKGVDDMSGIGAEEMLISGDIDRLPVLNGPNDSGAFRGISPLSGNLQSLSGIGDPDYMSGEEEGIHGYRTTEWGEGFTKLS